MVHPLGADQKWQNKQETGKRWSPSLSLSNRYTTPIPRGGDIVPNS